MRNYGQHFHNGHDINILVTKIIMLDGFNYNF